MRSKEPEILTLLLLQVALFVVAVLLTPKPEIEDARPGGIGDFSFPTATEGRAIPVLWGTAEITAPNVIWYGDLATTELTEKVGGGIFSSGEKVVVGFEYSIGIDFALCYGPINSLTRIRVGDQELFSGSAGGGGAPTGAVLAISDPAFFGEQKKGGGIVGDLRVYDGVPAQVQNSYMAAVSEVDATLLPGYVDLAHCVWEQGQIGESTNIDPWKFTVSRFPDNLALTSNNHIVNGIDANPAEVMHEILTDSVWGLDIDPGKVDFTTFQSIGNTLFTEGNGFSFVLDKGRSAQSIITEILRQIDAILFQTADGVISLKLTRFDFSVPSLQSFDETNIVRLESFARAAWPSTQNSIELKYKSSAKEYKDTSARAQDLANVRIQGQTVLAAKTFPGVKDDTLAQILAARELRQLSFPLAKVSLVVNREGSSLKPGDVIKWSWSPLGITDLVLRVGLVDLGNVTDGEVTLECIEDIFQLGTALFNEAIPTNWTPLVNTPIAAVNELILDSPFWYVLTDPVLQGSGRERAFSLVERPSGTTVGFVQNVDRAGSPVLFEVSNPDGTLCPTALVDTTYLESTADVDPVGLIVKSAIDIANVGNSAAGDIGQFGAGICLVNDELLAFETLVDNGDGTFTLDNVHRGLLDTVPGTHAVNDRVWFLAFGKAPTTVFDFGSTDSVSFKHQTETTTGTLALASATSLPFTFTQRKDRPLPPGQFEVNGVRYPTDITTNDATVTWAHRHRDDTTILDQDDPDSSLGQDADVEYVLTFKDGVTQIRQVVLDTNSPPPTGGTWTSYLYTRAQIKIDAGAPTGPFDLTAELFARFKTGGLVSRTEALITRTFNVDLP